MCLFRENDILYNVEKPTLEGPSFLPFYSLKIPVLRLADQHNLDLTGKKMHIKKRRKSFSMVDTLIVHRNDVKCSKPKWNHNLQVSGLIAKFWTILTSYLWSMRVWNNGNLFFTISISILEGFLTKIAPERQKNNGLYSNIHCSTQPISAREIAQLL